MENLNKRIFFKKPDCDKLNKQGFNAVDMHFHSRYSDTVTKIRNIIKKARKMKIGVAVTDHNEIRGNIEASKNNKGVMIIPGMELSCSEGTHILTYFYNLSELTEFYNKHVKNNKSKNPYTITKLKVPEVLDVLQDYNCMVAAAHPYGYLSTGLLKGMNKKIIDKEVIKNIHALEVISGEMSRKKNIKAVKSASFLAKAITAGSDGHSLFQLGHCLSYSKADNINDFLDNIKKNKNSVIGKEIGWLSSMIPATKSIGKHMRYIKPLVSTNYKASKKRRVVKKEQKQLNKKVRKYR